MNYSKETEVRINTEIMKHKIAYEIEDVEGNTFVYSHIENGCPVYRGSRGSTHIFDLKGFKIIEKYCSL